jgi:hypothetical protein
MLNKDQPSFAEVARIIAKEEPPEWLVPALEEASRLEKAMLRSAKVRLIAEQPAQSFKRRF